MKPNRLTAKALTTFIFVAALAVARPIHAQDAKSYPTSMAPIDQYLMDRDAEIVLAKSAAPGSIAKDAEVWVLGRKGYETAVKGSNGFVCIVDRPWTSKPDDEEFWSATRRAPICFNAAGARSYLPNTIMRTSLALAGRSKAAIFEAISIAYENKQLPPIEPGAMCYMLSKQGHLSDRDGHWHPHLMFFVPTAETPAAWGANLPGSPVLADVDTPDHLTVFLVPVGKWSDGTPDSNPH